MIGQHLARRSDDLSDSSTCILTATRHTGERSEATSTTAIVHAGQRVRSLERRSTLQCCEGVDAAVAARANAWEGCRRPAPHEGPCIAVGEGVGVAGHGEAAAADRVASGGDQPCRGVLQGVGMAIATATAGFSRHQFFDVLVVLMLARNEWCRMSWDTEYMLHGSVGLSRGLSCTRGPLR